MADEPPVPQPLKVVSHNVHGPNSPSKRQKVLQHLHSQKVDVALLQETHFPKSYRPTFIHSKFPTFYLSNTDDKTKGVGIIFSHKSKFSLKLEHKDPEGRYILVTEELDDQNYSFLSYYALNKGQLSFFQSMLKTLTPLLEAMIIIGGDSNRA